MYSIGQLSKATAIKVSTLRYYEEIGLISKPDRSVGNQRRYEPSTLERVNFISHCRDLGLSIDSIRDLITLSKMPDMPCIKAHKIAEDHLEKIRLKMLHLKKLQIELKRISEVCDQNSIGECKVIEAFGDHDACLTDHRP
ncbi:MAG: helix-turn-helix domain-containing protein [Pseudomonadota bacterium]